LLHFEIRLNMNSTVVNLDGDDNDDDDVIDGNQQQTFEKQEIKVSA